MGYSTRTTDRFFKEDENGETLFYFHGWSKPLVIESDEQLKRVDKKHRWESRISLLVSRAFMFAMIGFLIMMPESAVKVLMVIAWPLVMWTVIWLVNRVAFWSELRELKRHSRRRTFKDYYIQVAKETSKAKLVRELIIWMLIGVFAVWFAFGSSGTPSNQVLGIMVVVLLGPHVIALGIALKLKDKAA